MKQRLGAIVLCAAFAALTPAATAATSSTTFQGDASRSGAIDDPNLGAPLHVAWRAPIDGVLSYPVITKNEVFVVSNTPTVYDGVTRMTRAVGLRESDGEIEFSEDYPGTYNVANPATSPDGQLYILDYQGDVFDADTQLDLPQQGNSEGGIPAVSNGLLVAPAHADDNPQQLPLLTVNTATDTLRWGRSMEFDHIAPAIADGQVLLGNDCPGLAAYATSDGREVRPLDFSCGLSGGLSAVTDTDGTLAVTTATDPYAKPAHVDALSDGHTLYATSPALLGSAISGGRIFLYDGATVWAVNATTGERLWTWTLPTADTSILSTPPLVADGVVYTGSNDHHLYGLDAASGKLVSSTDVGGPVSHGRVGDAGGPTSGLGAGDGYLFVPTDGALVALKGMPYTPPTAGAPPAAAGASPPSTPAPTTPTPAPARSGATPRASLTAASRIRLSSLRRHGLALTLTLPGGAQTVRAALLTHGRVRAQSTWHLRNGGRRSLRLRLSRHARVTRGRYTLRVVIGSTTLRRTLTVSAS